VTGPRTQDERQGSWGPAAKGNGKTRFVQQTWLGSICHCEAALSKGEGPPWQSHPAGSKPSSTVGTSLPRVAMRLLPYEMLTSTAPRPDRTPSRCPFGKPRRPAGTCAALGAAQANGVHRGG
jgi:hypothetical protein